MTFKVNNAISESSFQDGQDKAGIGINIGLHKRINITHQ